MQKTQEARLKLLRNLEGEMPEEDIPSHDLIRFEIEHCGTPVSIFPELKDEYAVLEVDDRYSPKVRLCSLATGRTGAMKLKKALYRYQPLEAGAILKLLSWERRPAYQYIEGKARVRQDTFDLWITDYELVV